MRFGYTRLDKPQGFYRTGLSNEDLRLALSHGEWQRLFQVVAGVADKILPEAAVRYEQMHGGRTSQSPIEKRIQSGSFQIVRQKLNRLVISGKVEKDGKGKDARYRWIEKQDANAKADSA
jgi:ribosomal protein S19E (S16A)